MIYNKKLTIIFLVMLAGMSNAELKPVSDAELGNTDAQAGLSLSGSIDFNTYGGPLWDYNRDGNGNSVNCTVNSGKCGARIAVKATDSGGWFILDNVSGGFSFGPSSIDPNADGLTLRVANNNTATNNATQKTVLEVGLPSKTRYTNLNMTVAAGNNPQLSTGSGVQQTNLLSLRIHGDVVNKGKLLLFSN